MTFDNFINKWNGKYCDFDGKYGFQCVDLMRQYLIDVLGLNGYTIPPVTYAKQIFYNFPDRGTSCFQKVKNSPINYPVRGDIVIWGPYLGYIGWTGHVAICSGADTYHLITFDQHWGNPNFCKFVNHDPRYRGVLGWLHPIK